MREWRVFWRAIEYFHFFKAIPTSKIINERLVKRYSLQRNHVNWPKSICCVWHRNVTEVFVVAKSNMSTRCYKKPIQHKTNIVEISMAKLMHINFFISCHFAGGRDWGCFISRVTWYRFLWGIGCWKHAKSLQSVRAIAHRFQRATGETKEILRLQNVR